MVINICDFIIFPVSNAVWYGQQYHEWHPLTLQGGGLFHVAMGAILGVATWQRTQEKLAIYKSNVIGMTAEQAALSSSNVDVSK